MKSENINLPLVYSCSGCSTAAQMANHVALRLDRRGVAEMSCIAGVGGNVRPLVRLATGRTIIAMDGCALAMPDQCGCYQLNTGDAGVQQQESSQQSCL